ncbi:MAG: hypothetical protein PUF16_07090 [Lachnospiraceae bacterium]|nr:hypothetical protein [Lachnospiraceae bacterium]
MHNKTVYSGKSTIKVPKRTKVTVKVRAANWIDDDETVEQYSAWTSKSIRTDAK